MQLGNRTCLTSAVRTGAFPLACATGVLPPQPALGQASREPVTFLDQAWSQGERDWYYQFSQGSTMRSSHSNRHSEGL